MNRLESEIAKLEHRQRELTTELEDSATYEKPGYAVKINREFSEIQGRLEEVTSKWEKVGMELAAVDASYS